MKSTVTTIQTTHELACLTQIQEASAVIVARTLSPTLQAEVALLMQDMYFAGIRLIDKIPALMQVLEAELPYIPTLRHDIEACLEAFQHATDCRKIAFSLAPVAQDMCRRFHTDVVDYRLLCSYMGVGTYFVRPEDAWYPVDEVPHEVIQVMQVGEVILFRGAKSATDSLPALLHKSPPVEASQTRRLLLRLDTNNSF